MDDKAMWAEMSRQHRELKREVHRLRGRLGELPKGGAVEGWHEATLEEVALLRDCLGKHFALEERDGYLEPVIERNPNLSGKVGLLCAQHAAILREVDRAESACRSRMPAAEVSSLLGAALDSLERHEAEESDLVQSALSDDIGAAD
jgi:hypothetical protein